MTQHIAQTSQGPIEYRIEGQGPLVMVLNGGHCSREFLWASPFLLAIGLLFLSGLAVLARRYWFSVPFMGIGAALLCYAAGLIALFL